MGFPTVLLTPEQNETLKQVIHQANEEYGECSWLGVGKPGECNGEWVITNLLFPEQENSKGRTDMDDEKLAKLQLEIAPTWEEDERVIWWGHSHGNMNVFYSGTDYETWEGWVHREPEFFLGTCHNVKGEIYTRVNIGPYDVKLSDNVLKVVQPRSVADKVEDAMSNMSKLTTNIGFNGWQGYHTQQPGKLRQNKQAIKASSLLPLSVQDDDDLGLEGFQI